MLFILAVNLLLILWCGKSQGFFFGSGVPGITLGRSFFFNGLAEKQFLRDAGLEISALKLSRETESF